jgi:lysozyme
MIYYCAMPPRKNKKHRGIKNIIYLMVGFTIVGIGYLGFLWWQNRNVGFVRYAEFGIPIPSAYEIHGIDVSRYQQRISWEAVKNMQVSTIKLSFAFIKATEGNNSLDPFFKRNWKKSKEAGIVRGAYHFFIASKDGKTQAQHFIKNVKLHTGDLPPVLDVEKQFGASAITLRTEVKEWLEVMENYYGIRPIIYTNVEFYKRYLQGYFDDYPLWVAHYLQPHKPRIKREWAFWQHSEKGSVSGIFSKVDFNVFNGDSVQFKSLLVP